MQVEVENGDGWRLNSINISYHSWEKDQPYRGKISFINKSEESLNFNIPPDKMQALLALIADSVVDSASRLGHRMAASVQHTLKQQPILEAPLPEPIASELTPEQLEEYGKLI